MTLWEKIGQINKPDMLIAYLTGITRIACLEFRRRQERLKTVSMEESYAILPGTASEEGPDQIYERKENMGSLCEALDTLDEQERAAIILRYFKKRKIKEVADALGISVSTVKRVLVRGLEKLKSAMSVVLPGASVETLLEKSADILPAAPALSGVEGCSTDGAKKSGQNGRQRIFFICAAFVIAAALLAGSRSLPIRISQVKYDRRPRREPLEISAEAESVLPVKEMRISGPGGMSRKGEALGDGKFVFTVSENGSYVLSARSNNGRTAVRSFTVDCFDREKPVLVSTAFSGKLARLTVKDRSGIGDIYCEDKNGQKYSPVRAKPEAGEYYFDLPDGDYTTFAGDLAGNSVKGSLKVSR